MNREWFFPCSSQPDTSESSQPKPVTTNRKLQIIAKNYWKNYLCFELEMQNL